MYLIFLIILGLLNLILKEWCIISRGAEPHARKANVEKVLKRVAHRSGLFRDERSAGLNKPLLLSTYTYVCICIYIYVCRHTYIERESITFAYHIIIIIATIIFIMINSLS